MKKFLFFSILASLFLYMCGFFDNTINVLIPTSPSNEIQKSITSLLNEPKNPLSPSSASLNTVIQSVVAEAQKESQTSDNPKSNPGEFNRETIERSLDSIQIDASEVPIFDSFGKGNTSVKLRRILFGRRYSGYIAGSEKLEDLYLAEISENQKFRDEAVEAIKDVLSRLPKTQYREEHVVLWDLINRIPEGHANLQKINPDEEFL